MSTMCQTRLPRMRNLEHSLDQTVSQNPPSPQARPYTVLAPCPFSVLAPYPPTVLAPRPSMVLAPRPFSCPRVSGTSTPIIRMTSRRSSMGS